MRKPRIVQPGVVLSQRRPVPLRDVPLHDACLRISFPLQRKSSPRDTARVGEAAQGRLGVLLVVIPTAGALLRPDGAATLDADQAGDRPVAHQSLQRGDRYGRSRHVERAADRSGRAARSGWRVLLSASVTDLIRSARQEPTGAVTR